MADLMQYDSEGIRGVASAIDTAKETVNTAVTNMYNVIRGFGADEWSGSSYNNFVKHCDEFKASIDILKYDSINVYGSAYNERMFVPNRSDIDTDHVCSTWTDSGSQNCLLCFSRNRFRGQ